MVLRIIKYDLKSITKHKVATEYMKVQNCHRIEGQACKPKLVLILIMISRESSGISTVEMIMETNYEILEMNLMLMCGWLSDWSRRRPHHLLGVLILL